jgi:hypothetical protein
MKTEEENYTAWLESLKERHHLGGNQGIDMGPTVAECSEMKIWVLLR